MCAWYGHQELLAIQRLSTCLIMRAMAGGDLDPRDLWKLHGDVDRVDLKKLERLQKQAEQTWK